jgi:hypothetical protein
MKTWPSNPERRPDMTKGNPLAYVLWVLVGAGLAYGVFQTIVKSFSLFTE